MEKSIAFLQDQLTGIRTHSISCGLIESVKVGNDRIAQIAKVTKDSKGIIVATESAADVLRVIRGHGYNAYLFSKNTIVVSVPLGGTDKVVKQVRQLGEEAKLAIRSIRKAYRDMDAKQLQKLVDFFCNWIEEIIEKKIVDSER